MIVGFDGLTGSGKTLSMVINLARKYRQTGKPIFANFQCKVPAIDFRKWNRPVIKGQYVNAIVLRSDDFIDRLLKERSGIFAVDEAGFVFNNRKWRTLPFELVARFQQSRKLGVDIFYTTQNIMRVDMTLRELTHMQVMCRMDYLPFATQPYILRNFAYYNPLIGHDSPQMRILWGAYSEFWFSWQFKKFYPMYDTLELVDFSVGDDKKKIIKPLIVEHQTI